MITKTQFDEAVIASKDAQNIINKYTDEQRANIHSKIETGSVFTDEELVYSAEAKCPCGHGMAYPEGCGPSHYWDCSAVLKGIADKKIIHEAKLPFAFYEIRGESATNGSTRPEEG